MKTSTADNVAMFCKVSNNDTHWPGKDEYMPPTLDKSWTSYKEDTDLRFQFDSGRLLNPSATGSIPPTNEENLYKERKSLDGEDELGVFDFEGRFQLGDASFFDDGALLRTENFPQGKRFSDASFGQNSLLLAPEDPGIQETVIPASLSDSPTHLNLSFASPTSDATFESLKHWDMYLPNRLTSTSGTNLYSNYFGDIAQPITIPNADNIEDKMSKRMSQTLEESEKTKVSEGSYGSFSLSNSDPPLLSNQVDPGDTALPNTAPLGKTTQGSTQSRLQSLYDRVGKADSSNRPISCGCCGKTFNGFIELAKHIDDKKLVRENFCPDETCTFSVIGFNRRIALRRHICNHHLKEYNARTRGDKHTCSLPEDDYELSESKEDLKQFLKLVYVCKVSHCARAFYRLDSLLRHHRCVHQPGPQHVTKFC